MNAKYLNISLHELIIDDDFVSWVVDPDEEKNRVWKHWLDKHPDQAPLFDQARKEIIGVKFDLLHTSDDKKEIWSLIENSIHETTSGRSKIKTLVWPMVAAACIGLIVVSQFLFQSKTITSTHGPALTHVLPDQSKVWLNDQSTITYKSRNFPQKRFVSLNGEAYFDVESGLDFIVNTDFGTVEVLGTTFNISDRDDSLTVECYSGKVRVNTDGQSLVLTPGEKAISVNNTLTKITGKTEANWIKGLFIYNNTALDKVAKEIERQFGVKIHLTNAQRQMTYTGFFEENNLQESLESVFWPLKLKYEIDGKNIKISD